MIGPAFIGAVSGESSTTPSVLWTPANLSTAAKIWLKETGLVDAGGGAISQWTDESGSGWDFTQSTSASRPVIVPNALNGKSVAIFDGSNDVLVGVTSANALYRAKTYGWAMHLFKKTASGSAVDRAMFAARYPGVGWYTTYVGSSRGSTTPVLLARRLSGDSASFFDGTSLSVGWHMLMGVVNWGAGTGQLYVDGSLMASANPFTSTGTTSNIAANEITLGAGSSTGLYADVSIGEHLAGDATLSTGDIDKLFGYMAWKWGLQSLLPVGHPYKSAPPTV
ncbi:hypothetical protein ACQKIE_00245 [Luteibacter sp. NPDC031894]|uniref:hypothetical protein n=1 Tax=Luteibacter sp. NPDC031894 TaxID=3390572 RepID=UPI003D02A51C